MKSSVMIFMPLFIMAILSIINLSSLSGVSVGGNCLTGQFCYSGVSLLDTALIVTVLGIAIAVGVISGFNILGSGMNTGGTFVVVKATIFSLLWAISTVMSLNLLFQNFFTDVLYMILTLIYLSGVAMNLGGEMD